MGVWIRRAALGLTVATGFTGLVYEVAWEKLLATLLGSHSAAAAVVLGVFLGGLAAGYALFGRLTRRLLAGPARGRPRLLLVYYGAAEAAIGLHALAFLPLLELARSASLRLPGGAGPAAFALDALLAAAVAGPGAVLMGATIPLLTQALARDLDHATRIHAQVYALNTAGAFAGALAAGFWLVPALGLQDVLWAMALVNLGAGAVFVGLGRWGVSATPADPPADPATARGAPAAGVAGAPGLRAFAAIALLGGFAMMALQTVYLRLGALGLGASQQTFSMVVAACVACIAVGSFGVAALRRIPRALLVADLWALAALLAILYAPLENVTWAAHYLRSHLGSGPEDHVRYLLATFAGQLAVLGPALVLSGATLPLIFHELRRDRAELGARAGTLYGWNTLGSLAGALLGGYLLLHWLDLHHVYRLSVCALAVAAGVASWRVLGLAPGRAAGAAGALVALVAVLPPWSPDRLSAGVFRDRTALPRAHEGPDAFFAANPRGRILFHTDDPTATISVKEGPQPDGRIDRAIVTNGKSDGFVIAEATTTTMLGLVPALLAERAERAFVIGYGTGVTAAALANLDDMREVQVAEISPGVIQAAPFFDAANGGASRHPSIQIVQGDAYRALLRSDRPFDVIVSEPSNPWVAGVEMLYSREFLTAARERLREGGVHGQWFHLYDADAATLGLVLRTYASVFEHVAVWYTLDADLLLLGVRDPGPALDIERLAARAARPDFARGLRRGGIGDLPGLLAHELLPLDVLGALPLEGPLHSLVHPRLAHAAARAFFAGDVAELPVSAHADAAAIGARHSLLRRLAERDGGALSEPAQAAVVAETCTERPRECAALLADWEHRVPRSAARDRLWREGAVPARVDGKPARERVDELLALHAAPGAEPTADPRRAAVGATHRFARYFHHAAPFAHAALADHWDRCERSPELAARCGEQRAAAERLLGPLPTRMATRSRAEPSGLR